MIEVLLTGGVGDQIVSLGIVNELKRRVGDFKIVCNFPDVHRFYTGEESDYFRFDRFQEYTKTAALEISSLVRSWNWPDRSEWQAVRKDYEEFVEVQRCETYIRMHPQKDGDVSRIYRGRFNRSSFPAAMLGLHHVPAASLSPELPDWFRQTSDYLTIHDGFGLFHGTLSRATKTWDLTFWGELVSKIRTEFPALEIIQLGGPGSRKIPGVHLAFLNSFDYPTSFQILAHSVLHIDGDSGLVHAARTFGVPAVVLFGPTPAHWFGYPENINIQTTACEPCYWTNDTWVSHCPKGLRAPACMNSIYPDRVFESVRDLLNKKGTQVSPDPLFVSR